MDCNLQHKKTDLKYLTDIVVGDFLKTSTCYTDECLFEILYEISSAYVYVIKELNDETMHDYINEDLLPYNFFYTLVDVFEQFIEYENELDFQVFVINVHNGKETKIDKESLLKDLENINSRDELFEHVDKFHKCVISVLQ